VLLPTAACCRLPLAAIVLLLLLLLMCTCPVLG
jgi:hypothetical protein